MTMNLNGRPSRNETMMSHAYITSGRSTCSRLQVGAVIARDARVLVTGYNGAPAGMKHCNHVCVTPNTCRQMAATSDGQDHCFDCPAQPGCTLAVHAEANVVAFAARYGVTLDGTELFTTHQPCYACAQLIINAGIMRVVYKHPYRLADGLNLLISAGIEMEHFQL